MAESTPYFSAIVATRSMLVKDPSSAAGATISLETQGDLATDTVGLAIQENYPDYVPYKQFLALEDQELIDLYFQSEKPQWCLAAFHRSTQTLCSQRLKMALKRLALMAQCHGEPDRDVLEEVLENHHLNRLVPNGPTTAHLVVEYRQRRSFAAVTEVLRCQRPQARRALIASAAGLLKDEHEEHTAFGAYIHGMIDQASVLGQGYSDNKRMKLSHGFSAHPDVVGHHRIQCGDVHAATHVLVSRASF